MEVELYCPHCTECFLAGSRPPVSDVFDRMAADDRGCALGDGQTFEDLLFTELHARDPVSCPGCGETVAVRDEDLNHLAMELLAQW